MKSRVTFMAVGNGSLSLNLNGKVYTAVESPLLVRGSLLSPLHITPAYATGPAGHDMPGCVSASNKASWTLTAPFYTNQSGNGITFMPFQDFTVLVSNPATGYEASCMSGSGFGAGLDPTPVTGPLTLICAGSEFQASGGGLYSITTDASFDPSSFRFSVNQTWYCDNGSGAKP